MLQDNEKMKVQYIRSFGEICGFPVILTEHFLQDFQCRPSVRIFSGITHWNVAKEFNVISNFVAMATKIIMIVYFENTKGLLFKQK